MSPDDKLYAAVLRRARTRWPEATLESIAAVLQTRGPELAALYEVAGPELEQLASENPVLREALSDIATLRELATESGPDTRELVTFVDWNLADTYAIVHLGVDDPARAGAYAVYREGKQVGEFEHVPYAEADVQDLVRLAMRAIRPIPLHTPRQPVTGQDLPEVAVLTAGEDGALAWETVCWAPSREAADFIAQAYLARTDIEVHAVHVWHRRVIVTDLRPNNDKDT
ncbi:hypothetical protein ACIA8R_29940 [Nonomuraea sp. NPDC051191]|uniref:hypothetical protein n=1 Tax=Nonomuraea sp. NPDC051191 TaxID=3364372 RepID=UPI00378942BF